jgi:hypothetical protein
MPLRRPPIRSILAAAGALLVACAPTREAVAPAAPPITAESATAAQPVPLEPAQPADPGVIPALADVPDDNPYLPIKASSRPPARLSARRTP